MKKTLKLEINLYTILQILSVTAFEKVPILQVLTNYDYMKSGQYNPNQLFLFDF